MPRPHGVQGLRWTTEKVDFVRSLGGDLGDDALAAAFAERFGITLSVGQVRGVRARYHIPKPDKRCLPQEYVARKLTVAQTRLGVALGLAYEAADALEASGQAEAAEALRTDVRSICSYMPDSVPPSGKGAPESLPAPWPDDLPRAAGDR